eukprot:10586569-Alexandrium_andersonii.AAC.1
MSGKRKPTATWTLVNLKCAGEHDGGGGGKLTLSQSCDGDDGRDGEPEPSSDSAPGALGGQLKYG